MDHPRSRGVYSTRPGLTVWSGGSSPLARGLPQSDADGPGWSRIIPARAGFTHSPGERRRLPADHPRSRGVYPLGRPLRSSLRGSSPLARGLRGFTTHTCTVKRDHPRSRGVYRARTLGRCSQVGSSPLARGLRGRGSALCTCVRIIPARAGFTFGTLVPCPRHKDHPRSRGVYSIFPG